MGRTKEVSKRFAHTLAKNFGISVEAAVDALDSMVAAGIFLGFDDEGDKVYFDKATVDLFRGLSRDPVMREQQIHQLADGVMRVRELN